MELELKGKIILGTEDKEKIELTRGQKGTYGWTITSHGGLPDPTLADITYIDGKLREFFVPLVPAPEES